MKTNSEVKVKVCKKQTTIPASMRDQTLRKFSDVCGKPKQHYQVYTKYLHPNRPIHVIIDEPRNNQAKKYTVTTTTGYARDSETQQSIISSVEGDIHDLVSSLGLQPHHSWIEKGWIFSQDGLTIRVFSVFNVNEENLDPENLVVSIESISAIATYQSDDAKQRIELLYSKILNDRLAYAPRKD